MSVLKLRGRFRAVKSLNSILSAMEVVTTVQLQRLKERYAQAEVYLRPMKHVLYGRLEPVKTTGRKVIVLQSARGLCGGFNEKALQIAEGFQKEHPRAELVKLADEGKLTYARGAELWRGLFSPDKEIYVAYNNYRGSINTTPTVYRLYPLPQDFTPDKKPAEVTLEPTPEVLVKRLFAHFLEARFYQLLVNSKLSELTARLMVLHGSVDNSSDLIDELRVRINKMRQASITGDLAEVISSAEAMRRNEDE